MDKSGCVVKLIGAVIFVIAFLLMTLISIAVPQIPPADMVIGSFIPPSDYNIYINAIVNGVIYGLATWIIFSVVNIAVKKGKKAEVKLATCPKCKSIVPASKTWTMDGRPNRMGRRMQLEIGLFDCPQCSRTFRKVLSKKQIT